MAPLSLHWSSNIVLNINMLEDHRSELGRHMHSRYGKLFARICKHNNAELRVRDLKN